MDYKAAATDDPRLIEKEIAGRAYKFFLCRRGYRIAKHKWGYDYENPPDGEEEVDTILRMLWVAQLPFSPELSFDEFEMRFLTPDYPVLLEVTREIREKQTRQDEEGDPPKKTGRGK